MPRECFKKFESRLESFDPSATGIQKQIHRLKCNQMLSFQALKILKMTSKSPLTAVGGSMSLLVKFLIVYF